MPKQVAHVGNFLGDYRITDELSSTATRRVFLGETISSPPHFVAIKWLHNVHFDVEQEESFLQETHFLQQLQHPHILSLIDAGCEKGVPYIVTTYAPEGSLDKTLQYQTRRPRDLDQAILIISQIGQALQYAHRQNIIHCNLKPQNILFDAQGRALLADFRLVSLPESLDTAIDSLYMAPEQFTGTISQKCDQYALGCIAYEMLTGYTPYQAQSLHYPGSRQRLPRLIPPTHFNPLLPAHVEQAILTALALEPAQRHRTIQAFLTALGATTISVQMGNTTFTPANILAMTAQSPLEADLLGAIDPYTANSTPPVAKTQRNGSSNQSKTGIFKYRKLLVALTCTLIFASIGSGLYALTFALPKSQAQMTPMTARTSVPVINTPTAVITPTQAASPTPTTITQPITLQPHPTATKQPAIPPLPTPTRPQATPTPTPISTAQTGTLTITPSQLSSANCRLFTTRSYLCTIRLTLSANATARQTWFAYSVGVVARVIPFIGTISPGQTLKVSIIVFDRCTHPGAFVFSIGHGRTITIISWAC